MGDCEFGTCSVCKKEVAGITRKYFYYDLDCECCSMHFEKVYHCNDCIPVEPTTTKLSISTKRLKELMAKDGLYHIGKERKRQKEVEGWTDENDDKYVNNELADAAICYLVDPQHRDTEPFPWPWDESWWKPSEDRIRELEKAGALIVAEIDRLRRQKEKNKQNEN
jgi:hypothetical protein